MHTQSLVMLTSQMPQIGECQSVLCRQNRLTWCTTTRWSGTIQITKSIYLNPMFPFWDQSLVLIHCKPKTAFHTSKVKNASQTYLTQLSFGWLKSTCNLLGSSLGCTTTSAYYRSDSFRSQQLSVSLLSLQDGAISVISLITKLKVELEGRQP